MIRLKLLAELSGRHWVDLGDEDILVKDGIVHFGCLPGPRMKGGRCGWQPKTSPACAASRSIGPRFL